MKIVLSSFRLDGHVRISSKHLKVRIALSLLTGTDFKNSVFLVYELEILHVFTDSHVTKMQLKVAALN